MKISLKGKIKDKTCDGCYEQEDKDEIRQVVKLFLAAVYLMNTLFQLIIKVTNAIPSSGSCDLSEICFEQEVGGGA